MGWPATGQGQVMQRTTKPHPPRESIVRVARRGLRGLSPLLLAVVVSLALGVPTVLFPYGPDKASFAYIAHRMTLGGFSYVTAWDQKPPAIYFIYLIGIHFPGPLMRNMRLFDLLVLCLT